MSRKDSCLNEVSYAVCYRVSEVSCDDIQPEPSVSPSLCLTPLQRRVPPSSVDAWPEVALGHEIRAGSGSGQPSRPKVSHRLIQLSETVCHWLSDGRRTLSCSPSAKPSYEAAGATNLVFSAVRDTVWQQILSLDGTRELLRGL